MKKCEEFQEMVSAYVDGELADAETSKLFFHLGECKECRTFMKSVLQLRTALRENELPIQTQSSSAKISVWKRKLAVSYPVAAVMALTILVFGFFFLQQVSQQPVIVEKVQTEYVYMISFPAVYAQIAPSSDVKSN